MEWDVQHVRAERREVPGGVLEVVLDRAASRNAMTTVMVAEILAILDTDEAVAAGAIVLSGGGRGFCAGSDLAALAAMTAGERSRFEADCGTLARRIVAYPRPVVCAVHGFAIGGGLTLAAACDIVVSSPDAKWSLPEVPIGLFPAWGLEGVTTRAGIVAARRLSFGIDILSGADAHACGLVDRLADDPVAAARDIAAQLAGLPHAQCSFVKEYFAVPRRGEEADRHANRLFTASCATDEAEAGFKRFVR
ncbi:enoyl-CoA hydratase/isomerase family protein [Croceicoccus mobilis]|uniref:2-(1,2-epoxy-1,2-dihydrophenyl)acetyl-CoA isomerase n=1 Tax=Croceicoccus mobilis TaxID=1703339 RepID=A0A916Z7W0_9SPHN|nr:enoyl-CoA hydratase/isomerase family protein [Croceicoccus mobilis]GGD80856.1 2-(1,2-epoxy-1,2-dihydrophenyl)acetyl-CoA isomerase [Croceicoccus mobilis]